MANEAPVSFKVRTTLGAYRIVAADTAGSNYVINPSAATIMPIGVTADTVDDTLNSIPVYLGGIAKVHMNDTMSTGSFVASDSAGRGVPHANTTAGSYVLGILVGPNVTATGTISDVVINPFFKSIP